jgi:hypothetical protein
MFVDRQEREMQSFALFTPDVSPPAIIETSDCSRPDAPDDGFRRIQACLTSDDDKRHEVESALELACLPSFDGSQLPLVCLCQDMKSSVVCVHKSSESFKASTPPAKTNNKQTREGGQKFINLKIFSRTTKPKEPAD